jgi:phenylalanyl-tRNA synthetase beta subunit
MNEFEKRARSITEEIEKLKSREPCLSYIECTVEICERYDIEFETVKKVLAKNIQEKIEVEAMELNLLTYKNNTLF